MARQRDPKNGWIPPNVKIDRHGNYRWERRGSGSKKIADKNASKPEVWAAYDALFQDDENNISNLMNLYFASPDFKNLAPRTRQDYLAWSARLKKVFGAAKPDDITSPDVQFFMDARGGTHPTAANHERSLLSKVFNWGKARGFVTIPNPCSSVKKIKVKTAARYIKDDEYVSFHNFLEKRHPMLLAAMEIAFLCAARKGDILRLTRDDITEEGLLICQSKTGKEQVKLWNNRLRAAVDLALSIQHKSHNTAHIIRTRTGRQYTDSGFNASWKTVRREAIEQGVISKTFRFHDLKIKSVSDYEGDKQYFSGHKTSSMMERYNMTPDRVVPIDTPLNKKSLK